MDAMATRLCSRRGLVLGGRQHGGSLVLCAVRTLCRMARLRLSWQAGRFQAHNDAMKLLASLLKDLCNPIYWIAAVLAAAILGLAGNAHAQTGTAILSCTPPTKNVDGTAIVGTISYKFYRGSVQGTYPTSQTSPNCATTFSTLPAGVSYFVSTAIVGGVESVQSNVASKLIPGAPPNPPTIPQPISVAGPVFGLQITKNSMVVPQVGTVVAGKNCDPTQIFAFGGQTFMRIDVANVTALPGLDLSQSAVFGSCQ